MLVHVALYVAWIDRVAWLVNEILRDYKLQIRSKQGNLLNELKELYENDFIPTTLSVRDNITYKDSKIKVHSWDDILNILVEAVTKIQVRAVHGTKNTRHLEYHSIEDIDYEESKEHGLSVIAVGGNRLARGITLEGLSVSYYLRTTRLYDSLMQMGRWFGYRPGYVDLCRLYTTEQLVNWYRHITLATEEMRADFDKMSAELKKPIDYQLKVRTHPEMVALNRLSITSSAKMKEHEIIRVGYSGKTIQTFIFEKDKSYLVNNYTAFCRLIERLDNPKNEEDNSVLWENVASNIIVDFLQGYKQNYHNLDLLSQYVLNQDTVFENWSVALILNSGKKLRVKEGKLKGALTMPIEIKLKNKTITGGLAGRNFAEGKDELSVKGRKNAILDKKARKIDLDIEDNASEEEIKNQRSQLLKPLLVLIPFDPRISDEISHETPIIGFGVSIPELKNEKKIEFAARPQLFDEEDSQIDDDIENEE